MKTVLSALITVFVCVVVVALSAGAQDDISGQTKALTVISDTADRLCDKIMMSGFSSDTAISGVAQAELAGVLKRFADAGVKGNAELRNNEYQGLVREQLASALKDSRDCKRDVFKVLVDRLLPKGSTSNNVGAVERIQAEVSDGCRRLQFWPRAGPTPPEDVRRNLERIAQTASNQELGVGIPSRTLASLNRCLGAAYLISGKGPPDNIREALPYLDRSLAFDPEQLLLRQNIVYLDQMLKTGQGDITVYLTTIFQVLRGSNDPEISDLVSQMREEAMKSLPRTK